MFIILGIIVLIGTIVADYKFIDIIKEKGHKDVVAYWIIGLILPLGFLAVGLFAVALPDLNKKSLEQTSSEQEPFVSSKSVGATPATNDAAPRSIDDELPEF